MKKLLVLLFSILISFNSFAGSLDGKGLKCEEQQLIAGHDAESIYIWFEKGELKYPRIEGYSITWWTLRDGYKEIGTNIVRFTNPYSKLEVELDRRTLRLDRLYGDENWLCSIVYSRQQIEENLNLIIDAAKDTNQI
mgnify:CR=1 FL=1